MLPMHVSYLLPERHMNETHIYNYIEKSCQLGGIASHTHNLLAQCLAFLAERERSQREQIAAEIGLV